jgi:hypothetical protein
MKLSTQTLAFLVFMAALLGVGLYVNNIEIRTDVNDRETTLLPNLYEWGAQNDVTGFSFRYPRGWRIEPQTESVFLSRPDDPSDPASRATIFVVRAEAPESAPESGLIVNEDAEGVTLSQAVPLGAVEGQDYYLRFRSSAPIEPALWDDLRPDFERITASVTVQELSAIALAFNPTLPPDWALNNNLASAVRFAASHQPVGLEESTTVDLRVLPPASVSAELNNILQQIGAPIRPSAQTPLEAFGALEGFTRGQGVETVLPLQEVEYSGISGLEYGGAFSSGEEFRLLVLDPKDGYTIFGIIVSSSRDLFSEDIPAIESILNEMNYTTPASVLFESEG